MLVDTDRLLMHLEEVEKTFEHFIDIEKNMVTKLKLLFDDVDSEVSAELNNSLIVMIYGRAECVVNDICVIIQRSLHLNLSYENLPYQGIGRAINYLYGLNLILSSFKENKTYKQIDNWRVIRNAIVHNYSNLDLSKKSNERAYFNTDISLDANSSFNIIQAKVEDVESFLNDLTDFFQELYKEIIFKVNGADEEELKYS